LGELVKYKTSKIYHTTKNSCQDRHIRPPSRISETLAGHIRPPRLDMFGLSALSDLAARFQRLWLDMSGLSALSNLSTLSSLSALSGLAAGFQIRWSDMFSPDPDMSGFLTLNS
jgi:hypothetical protein